MAYSNLISIGNLFQAWGEFKRGKRTKKDVQVFERHLENNLFELNRKLETKTYRHGEYSEFYVNDPKRRHIHKAIVEDRIVHHLLYKYLYDVFDKTFIFDSYSCRLNKGTHRAVKRLEKFARVVSKNYTQDCWALKLDIKQFFASVDHEILLGLISRRVEDKEVFCLIKEVINSFPSGVQPTKGIPLGNLTSQIFANIYLNELDQFIKHQLRIKYYLRYADDFIILDTNSKLLYQRFKSVKQFLNDNLKLKIHPEKISYRRLTWGMDFCGYIVLPHYILPRTKTKRRILKKFLKSDINHQSLESYLGYLSHSQSFKIQQNLKNAFYLNYESS